MKKPSPPSDSATAIDDPHLRLLADPQTCGGLLAAVPAAQAAACLEHFRLEGSGRASSARCELSNAGRRS